MVNRVSLNVKVVTGSVLLSSGGSSYSVTTITSHPNYNAYTYLNDISVLKTSSSITYTEKVQPLPISVNFVDQNINAVAVGWGLTSVREVLFLISNHIFIFCIMCSNSGLGHLDGATAMDPADDHLQPNVQIAAWHRGFR